MKRPTATIRKSLGSDREWIRALIRERWGAQFVVSRGAVHRPDLLRGFVAKLNGTKAGLATYRIHGGECEMVTLDSLAENRGVGTALLAAEAGRSGCRRLWLVTTNDNLRALGFYQKRGMRLVAVHRDALERSRRLKPGIPLVGENGIPLLDEIELDLPLEERAAGRPRDS